MIMEINNLPKKPVTCTMCMKSLSSRQNLRQHMNIHTGEKPYKCPYPTCEQCFKHASQLSNHKLVHQLSCTAPTNQFDDLRVFLRLIVKLFQSENFESKKPQFKILEKEKFSLPLVSSPQLNIKLPNFSEVSGCIQNKSKILTKF